MTSETSSKWQQQHESTALCPFTLQSLPSNPLEVAFIYQDIVKINKFTSSPTLASPPHCEKNHDSSDFCDGTADMGSCGHQCTLKELIDYLHGEKFQCYGLDRQRRLNNTWIQRQDDVDGHGGRKNTSAAPPSSKGSFLLCPVCHTSFVCCVCDGQAVRLMARKDVVKDHRQSRDDSLKLDGGSHLTKLAKNEHLNDEWNMITFKYGKVIYRLAFPSISSDISSTSSSNWKSTSSGGDFWSILSSIVGRISSLLPISLPLKNHYSLPAGLTTTSTTAQERIRYVSGLTESTFKILRKGKVLCPDPSLSSKEISAKLVQIAYTDDAKGHKPSLIVMGTRHGKELQGSFISYHQHRSVAEAIVTLLRQSFSVKTVQKLPSLIGFAFVYCYHSMCALFGGAIVFFKSMVSVQHRQHAHGD